MKYFLDTEFIEDGESIDLISIGIVAEDGRELYLQNADCRFPKANDWVARHVFPHLQDFDMGRRDRACREYRSEITPSGLGGSCTKDELCPWRDPHALANLIRTFCDTKKHGKPEFWTYFGAYDWVVLCQLFGAMVRLPEGWPYLAYDLRQWLDHNGRAALHQPDDAPHHALEDARWIAATYKEYREHVQSH